MEVGVPGWISFAAVVGSTIAAPTTPLQFGETCTGTEVVQVGSQPPKTIPYTLTFSIDLARKLYCANACDAPSTYRIKAVAPRLITLADIEGGPQSRHMTLKLPQSKLEDVQLIKSSLGDVSRKATATCKSAPFHAPTAK
jgi:hypothetical protein